jgi:hypothetical protein
MVLWHLVLCDYGYFSDNNSLSKCIICILHIFRRIHVGASLMNTKQSAHYMGKDGSKVLQLNSAILLVLLLLASNLATLSQNSSELEEQLSPSSFVVTSKASGGDVDVPSWRVNDLWTYDGYMDVATLLANSGVSSNIQTLTGDLDMWVEDILFMTVENQSTLVYKVRSHALFEANGVSLDGQTGNLDVDYDQTDFIRVSDLATVEMTMDIDVTFTVFIFNVDVGQMIITNEYSPPREQYDFPLKVGESWTNSYTNAVTWAGDSDYFDIPDDTVNQATSGHAVVAYGNPNVPYGSGCAGSYNVTSYDSNGTPDGFQWWCPAVGNDAWRHIAVDLGLVIDFKLKSHTPQTRQINLDVELETPAWILDASRGAWVNVTNPAGLAVAGQALEWRYEASGVSHSLTTAANGSAFIEFNTGNATDPSPTNFDWASHGIIAWVSASNQVGVDTFTLDDSIITLDYRPNGQGVSVERTRDGTAVILNPAVGFNAVPGDSLVFSIPIENLGILAGPATELLVTGPDGTTSRASISGISGLGTGWAQASWVVPSTQAIGVVTISFEVDPDGLMTGDQNQSNNIDTFDMFIGTIPTADLIQPPATKTLTNIHFDGRNSADLDGGMPVCTFVVETSIATNETFEEEDCLLENMSWSDDGTYRVWLTVTDDENDQDSTVVDVEILNRAPWVNVSTQNSVLSIPVESSVILFATDSGDLDTLNNEAPVDFLWQFPTRSDGEAYECESGVQVSPTCEVTPMEEGIFTVQVMVQDDDGAVTTADFNLVVTNIAPSDAEMTMWDGDVEMTDDRIPAIWQVNEDQVVTLKGTVHDSLNDIDSLSWGWQPDRDIDPNWYVETIGETSAIDVSWNESGTHVIAMEVLDDDGESSNVVNGWVQVKNLPPEVQSFDNQMPVGEDREFSLTGVYNDTASDVESLEVCWDVDFEIDLDENGDAQDDCDFVGADITYHWSLPGNKTIRFHVTDNDGDSAFALVNITVVNLRPQAAVDAEKDIILVGEEWVVWTNETTDSESDMDQLIYSWDLDIFVDADDDGDPTNDLDMITANGEPLRYAFASEGVKNIRLTVSDESASSSVDMLVTVEPDVVGVKGWFSSNTAGVSNPVIILGLVLVALLVILGISTTVKKGRRSENEWLSGGPLYDETSPTAAPPTYAFEPVPEGSPPTLMQESPPAVGDGNIGTQVDQLFAPEPVLQDPPTETVQVLVPAFSTDISAMDDILLGQTQNPPVPATGLPAGWDMEQWNHYGAQWLIDNESTPTSTDNLDLDI